MYNCMKPTHQGRENIGESGISGAGRTDEKGFFPNDFLSLRKRWTYNMLPYFFTFPGKKGEWRCGESDEKYVLQPSPLSLSSWLNGCCRTQRKRAIFYFSLPLPFASLLSREVFSYSEGWEFLAEKQKRKRETRLCEYTAGFTSKYTSKIRGALKDLELQADLVHETTSGA